MKGEGNTVKESVWKAESKRGPRISRRVRVAVVLAIGLVLLALAFVFRDYSVSKPIELDAFAEPGPTRVLLSGEEQEPMSPGCGCLDPSFGAHEWFGMSLPSTGFDMKVFSAPGEGLDGKRWTLTALSPELAPIDWYESPHHTLQMRVEAGAPRRVVFDGRTTYALAVLGDGVHVRHGRRYPYAALLPAAGGPVEFDSASSSRPEFGSEMYVRAHAPAREGYSSTAEVDSESEYRARTDLTQRGPMVDVLGPVVRIGFSASADTDLYAAYERIEGIRPGEPVVVTLRTPDAIRLFPQPANRVWAEHQARAWTTLEEEAAEGIDEAREYLKYGPAIIGRLVDEDPTPPYSVHLSQLSVPPPERWRKFAEFSSRDGVVPQMLDNHRADPNDLPAYQLPPVNPDVEVGVFGPLTELESSSMRGRVVTDGKNRAFGRGQTVTIESDQGLATGRYQMTPLVSAGLTTNRANAAGDAKVSIDGDPVNTLPFLPVLLGALAVIVFGLGTEAFLKWGLRP